MRQVTYRVLEKLGRKDSLLDIAMELEKIALQDEYFVKRCAGGGSACRFPGVCGCWVVCGCWLVDSILWVLAAVCGFAGSLPGGACRARLDLHLVRVIHRSFRWPVWVLGTHPGRREPPVDGPHELQATAVLALLGCPAMLPGRLCLWWPPLMCACRAVLLLSATLQHPQARDAHVRMQGPRVTRRLSSLPPSPASPPTPPTPAAHQGLNHPACPPRCPQPTPALPQLAVPQP